MNIYIERDRDRDREREGKGEILVEIVFEVVYLFRERVREGEFGEEFC